MSSDHGGPYLLFGFAQYHRFWTFTFLIFPCSREKTSMHGVSKNKVKGNGRKLCADRLQTPRCAYPIQIGDVWMTERSVRSLASTPARAISRLRFAAARMPDADSAPAKAKSFSGFIFLRKIATMSTAAATMSGVWT